MKIYYIIFSSILLIPFSSQAMHEEEKDSQRNEKLVHIKWDSCELTRNKSAIVFVAGFSQFHTSKSSISEQGPGFVGKPTRYQANAYNGLTNCGAISMVPGFVIFFRVLKEG